MVVSVNTEPNKSEFEILLNNTLGALKEDAQNKQDLYLELLGNRLEKRVFDVLTDESKGTLFDGSIELISGQKFPDIIAKKYYGVEVKTTKSNHWKSTGSSVAEGTRVDGVERIFMLFGKMCTPVDFMCKPYEDCLSEVVVTHSPRYLIDMRLKTGQTIFDKIGVDYDTLRKQEDPIKTVLKYYKSLLKRGESTWWSGDYEAGNNVIIRLWNSLKPEERSSLVIKGYCLFPEMLGNKTDKYSRFALWLTTNESVVCTNIRDLFSSGGQGVIEYGGKKYSNIPKIIINLSKSVSSIKTTLKELNPDVISEFWGCEIDICNLYEQWCNMIIPHTKKLLPTSFPFEKYMKSL